MPDPTDQPDAANREELVAYLDGELPPEEARAVEERLARDEAYRREMQGFDRAWHALEELPRATVDDSFTKTTIEMVAVAAQRDVAELSQALPAVRRRRRWWIAGIAAVAATLGFAVARVALDYPNRVLLNTLPVVQHFDAYDQNLSIDFLKQLPADAGEMLKPYEDAELQRQVEMLRAIDAASISQRSEMVEAMSDAEKAGLLANQNRFLALPRVRQEQLVELHGKLRDDPDSAGLQRTLLANWAWVQEQAPRAGEQAELRSAATDDDRITMMRQLDRLAGRRITLSAEELSAIREVLKQFDNDPRLQQAINRFWEQYGDKKNNQRRRRMAKNLPFANVASLAMIVRDSEERPELNRLWNELQRQLLAVMTAETREKVENLDPKWRAVFLLGSTFQATRAALEPSEAELEQLLTSDAIDNDHLQRLLALPKREMRDELTRIHIARELGGDWRELWRREGGGPSFGFGGGFRDRDSRHRGGRGREPRRPEDRDRRPGPPRGDRPPPADNGQRPPPPPPA